MNSLSFRHGLPFRYDRIYPRRIICSFVTGLGLHALVGVAAPPYVHPIIPIQEPPVGFIIPTGIVIPPPPKPIARPIPPGADGPGELVAVLDEDPTPPEEMLPVPPAPPNEGRFYSEQSYIVITKQPDLLHYVPPAYPEIAIEMGWAGKVTVELLIGEQGRVKAVKFPKNDAPEMIKEAIRAAMLQWMFRPAYSGHQPVSVWVPQVFEFGL